MRNIADAAFAAVGVQGVPARGLAKRNLRGNAGRAGLVERMHLVVVDLGDIPLRDGVGQGACVHGGCIGVQQAATCQFAEDGHDAASTVHVFDVVLGRVRCHLAQLRHALGQAVDIAHAERHLAFLCGSQQMQDGVGGAAHGDVQRHRVFERFEGGDAARQCGGVFAAVPAMAQFHRHAPGAQEQLLAVGMRGHHSAIAWQ